MMSWSEIHEYQLAFIRQIIISFPNWTINDVLETDIKYLYQLIFKTEEKKKTKRDVIPMHEYFKKIK